MKLIIIELQMFPRGGEQEREESRREEPGRQVEESPLPRWHSFLLGGIPASLDVNVLGFCCCKLRKAHKPIVYRSRQFVRRKQDVCPQPSLQNAAFSHRLELGVPLGAT